MSYQFYKILHISCIVIFFSTFAMSAVRAKKHKPTIIINGIALVLILVSGFGLIARIGISHGSGWPLWLNLKVAIWLVVGSIGHVAMKRFPQHLPKVFWGSIGLLVAASYLANYKIG